MVEYWSFLQIKNNLCEKQFFVLKPNSYTYFKNQLMILFWTWDVKLIYVVTARNVQERIQFGSFSKKKTPYGWSL